MKYIQVLVDRLPVNGYRDICKYYNNRKQDESQPIYKAGVCEGGFEICLNETEIQRLKSRKHVLDPNDTVRQVRWSNGWLHNMYYMVLKEDETLLLFEALQSVLGKDNVVYQEYTNNSIWWNSLHN